MTDAFIKIAAGLTCTTVAASVCTPELFKRTRTTPSCPDSAAKWSGVKPYCKKPNKYVINNDKKIKCNIEMLVINIFGEFFFM